MKLKTAMFTAGLLCFACFTRAQTIEKGSTLVGGGLSFGSQRTPNADSKNDGASISLSLAKAVKENSFVGLSTGFSHSRAKSPSGSATETNASIYSASIFYRKYFELGNKFYFFVQPDAGFSFAEYKHTLSSRNKGYGNTKSIGASLTPGLSYRLLKSLYMDVSIPSVASVSYSALNNNSVKNSSFQFNSSLSAGSLENIGLGFSFIF